MPITPAAINEFLGPNGRLRCEEVTPTSATAVITPGRYDLRPGGSLSGPTQFEAADGALWFLCFGAVDRIVPMALTTELSIRFLRPPFGDKLFARATVDRCSRRTLVGTVSVWTDDRDAPSAVAQGTYILPSDP